MAAAGGVCAGLIRHKVTLLKELCDTNILDVLVKKGLLSVSDLELITGAADSDKCDYFVEVVSKHSGPKLSELCSVLEKECPKLYKELMNDRHRSILNGFNPADSAKDNMVMSHNLNRESPRSRRSVSQCSCNSVSRRSSVAASPMPLPPLNNTMEMYVEPVVEDGSCKMDESSAGDETARDEGVTQQKVINQEDELARSNDFRPGEGRDYQDATSRGEGLARPDDLGPGKEQDYQDVTSRGEGLARPDDLGTGKEQDYQDVTSRGGGLARKDSSSHVLAWKDSSSHALAWRDSSSHALAWRDSSSQVLARRRGLADVTDQGPSQKTRGTRRISDAGSGPMYTYSRGERWNDTESNYMDGRESCTSYRRPEVQAGESMQKRHYTTGIDDCGDKGHKRRRLQQEERNKYCIDEENDPQRELGKERFIQIDTNDLFDKFFSILKEVRSSDRPNLMFNANVIPEFDPMEKEQTVLSWLTKIEECAEIYGWDEKAIIHYALPKLSGVAKTWYQGLPSLLFTWTEWKRKLIMSFPCREDYAELLTEMLAMKVNYGESLERYYYAKLNMLNRCKINGRQAVDCILYGIEDRAVKVGAQAAQFNEPEQVLKYFRSVKVTKNKSDFNTNKNKEDSRVLKQTRSSTSGVINNKIRCFNCNEIGHPSSKCDKPIKRCCICDKIGHESINCFRNKDNNNNESGLKNEKLVAGGALSR